MPATVADRFAILVQDLGISKNAFAKSLGRTATVIQHLIDGRNKPGFDLLEVLFTVYPNVSKDWLLLGVGEPYIDHLNNYPNDAEAKNLPTAINRPLTLLPQQEQSVPTTIENREIPKPEAALPVSATINATPPTPSTAPDLSDAQRSTTAPTLPIASAPAPVPGADTSLQAALYAQQLSHQLALAEMRNQHLLDQQRLMQQMLDLMQRQLSK
ncbi:hypothetical protein [Hymenobacter jejuensis]|uniref:Helix-turn-helix transcriptional regulator n=1 Tax=Hymenobacter jejuensis TaxID=2502781 RepID=A0A5B8A5H2_9BACT|nr:hypothetical protein [Hymenobacter jejuensis]QDA61855.1 hypothetical protein FHG12_17910 [Hymenobacter jejuensis]